MTTQIISNPPELTTKELYETVMDRFNLDDYKEIKAIHLAGLIDPSADAVLNARILRNYGHRLANPKRKRTQTPNNRKSSGASVAARLSLNVAGA